MSKVGGNKQTAETAPRKRIPGRPGTTLLMYSRSTYGITNNTMTPAIPVPNSSKA